MGDPSERREQLVRDHLRLAYYHARRLYGGRAGRGGLEVEDLEQEAVLGLMAASAQYDQAEHPGMPFPAFSRLYIVRHVNEAARRWERCRAEPLGVDLPAPTGDEGADRMALEVWDMLQGVPATERAILVRRYGLDGEPALGLVELAEFFGLPARSIGRALAMARSLVRRECKDRGFHFDRWAEAAAAAAGATSVA